MSALGAGGIAALLFAWVLRLETRRPGRRRGLRLALSVVAIAALWGLAVRPGRTVVEAPEPVELRTAGWRQAGRGPDRTAAPAVVAAERVTTPSRRTAVVALGEADAAAVESVPDVAALDRRRPAVTSVTVIGHGLPGWEWARLEAPVEAFTPAPISPGITRIAWRRRVALGEALVVRGAVSAPGALSLIEPGSGSGSTVAEPSGAFEISALPRRTGRFVYRLRFTPEAGEGGAEVAVETVVEARRPPRLLWIEGAPSFELRHFKPWYRDLPGELAIRTTISRGRYRTEGVLREPPRAGPIDAELLAGVDLVVVDPAAMAQLGRGERTALGRAIEEGGVGLLLRSGPGLTKTLEDPLFEGLALRGVDGAEGLLVRLSAEGEETGEIETAPRELVAADGRPMAVDRAGRVHAAYRPRGAGRVGVLAVTASYRWVLEGDPRSHRRLWSALVSALARPDRTPRWSIPSGPVLIDEPLSVRLEGSASDDAPGAVLETPSGATWRLAMSSEPLESAVAVARAWPAEEGWHRLSAGEVEAWFYAQEPAPWRAWRQRRAVEATRLRIAVERREAVSAVRAVERPWPAWLWFAGLLCGLSGLWIEERFAPGG